MSAKKPKCVFKTLLTKQHEKRETYLNSTSSLLDSRSYLLLKLRMSLSDRSARLRWSCRRLRHYGTSCRDVHPEVGVAIRFGGLWARVKRKIKFHVVAGLIQYEVDLLLRLLALRDGELL